MIPNFISGPAKAALQALRQPIKTGAAIRSITATLLIRGSDWVNNPDTQGNFNLPSELRRPFFIAAYIATFAVAAYYGYYAFHWLQNIAESDKTALTIIADGVKILPGFFAGILVAGLLFSIPVHAIAGGIGMLGLLLRKWEQSTRPENSKAIREVRQLRARNAELEEGRTQSEETIEALRNQIRRSGQEPEA